MERIEILAIEELECGVLFDSNKGFKNEALQGKQLFEIGNWRNPVEYYMLGGYNIDDGGGFPWEVKQEGDKKLLQYPKEIRRAAATLSYGELLWRDYEVSVRVNPLSRVDFSGVAFRYQNSRCYYLLSIGRGDRVTLLRRYHDEWNTICDDFAIDESKQEYELKVCLQGERIRCFIDGVKAYEVEDSFYPEGCIGLITYSPVNYSGLKLRLWKDHQEETGRKKAGLESAKAAKAAAFPKPVLYKVVKTPGYSSGEFRFVEDTAGTRMVFVQAKHLKPDPMVGNVYELITCITVTDLDGNILWQRGKPGEAYSRSFCYQVEDIDGDGKKEMVVAMNFEILILDFETGELKRKCPTPLAPKLAVPWTDGPEDFYPRICGDHIYLFDRGGTGKRNAFLIKDRYNNVWAYDSHLNFLWHMHFITGHFPYSCDINNDGCEEILLGHRCISNAGKLLWMLPLGDHVDNICVGNFSEVEGQESRIVYAAGEEGFVMTDKTGNILLQQQLGHVQGFNAGHFEPKLPGQQFIVHTLWGDQGLVYTMDCEGTVLKTIQLGHYTDIKAVNWVGDGRAVFLYSSKCHSHVSFYDFDLDKLGELRDFDTGAKPWIVMKDLMGDPRDEIVISSRDEVRFYTQENNGSLVTCIPMERRMPEYNYSIYRPEYLCRKRQVFTAGVTYYVDAVKGNDSLDGKSQTVSGSTGPWKTLGKVNGFTFAPGDKILLKAGGSWVGQLWPKGSGSSGSPIIIDMYGSGNKPVIDCQGVNAASVKLYNQQYWEINNLEVKNTSASVADYRGIEIRAVDSGDLNHIYIKNCYVHDIKGEAKGFGTNDTGYELGKRTGGIVFWVDSIKGIRSKFNDVLIQNNTLRNNQWGGLIFKQTNKYNWALREGGINDPNWYPHTNITVKDNYFDQSGSADNVVAILLTAVKNSTIDGNMVYKAHQCGIELNYASYVTVQKNEVYGTELATSGIDAVALDFDRCTDNTIWQYNYLNENRRGILSCHAIDSWDFGQDNIVRYNIVQNCSENFIQVYSKGGTDYVYNNVFFNDKYSNVTMVKDDQTGTCYMQFKNNIFYQTTSGGTFSTPSYFTYDNNSYYGAGLTAVAGDGHKVTVNPKFADPGKGGVGSSTGTALGTLGGYKLQTGSPCINTGTSISGNGGLDFWGTALYNGSAEIGAYEGSGVSETVTSFGLENGENNYRK